MVQRELALEKWTAPDYSAHCNLRLSKHERQIEAILKLNLILSYDLPGRAYFRDTEVSHSAYTQGTENSVYFMQKESYKVPKMQRTQ